VLLDFGAARRVISDQTQSLTAILKPSFAPIEQYGESTQMRQGAWTDLYALAAVLNFCITGRPPSTATSRVLNDEMPKLFVVRDALRATDGSADSEALLATIDAALSVQPQARLQTAAAFRSSLYGEVVPKTATGATPTSAEHLTASTTAVWLAVMLLRHAELLSDSVRQLAAHVRRAIAADRLSCRSCRAVNDGLGTFCNQCGTVLGDAAKSR
jgi:serine/threonine protein kinase